MRRLLVWLTLGVLVSACGAEPVAEPSPNASATQEVPDEVTPAPDFTLELGDGGTFTLSEETRPVFLVFWAEW